MTNQPHHGREYAPTAPMRVEPFQVQRVIQETPDTFTLELMSKANGGGFAFAPGQFNMLYVFGVGEVPISISGDPAQPGVLTHTIRAVGTVTNAMQRLRRGDVIGVRGPFGTAWRVEEARGKDVVFVVGGIGLAPLRPAIYHVLAHREAYGKVALLYGARRPQDILFRHELEAWGGRFDMEVQVTVDYADHDWRGSVGLVTQLIPRATFEPANTLAMTCGPEVMMRFSAAELLKLGVAAEYIDVSMERNMKCGIGLCGHCQLGPHFICKDGPVFDYHRVAQWFLLKEV